LEAKVVLLAKPEKYDFLKRYAPDLPGLFIVSQVELKKVSQLPHDSDIAVEVLKADGEKCARCWNYRASVGANATHPSICDRCVEAIS
jgi:isoleucyl-tRNA synthetase